MRLFKFFLFTIIVLIVSSCSTKKELLYLQNFDNSSSYISDYDEYLINVDDILKIDVNSDNPEAAYIFNRNGVVANPTNSKENMLFNGYQVDQKGYINFPIIGNIYVKDMTIRGFRDYLHNRITEEGYLIDPFIDIKILNLHFTILGEVNRPGRYEYVKNNLNIFEAIGISGDLTINGKRNNIKILREENGNKSIKLIDLTDTDILANQSYQILSGDIIIVSPNYSRVKNAGIIGNSGTLLSLLSFLLSSIIIINN